MRPTGSPTRVAAGAMNSPEESESVLSALRALAG